MKFWKFEATNKTISTEKLDAAKKKKSSLCSAVYTRFVTSNRLTKTSQIECVFTTTGSKYEKARALVPAIKSDPVYLVRSDTR